MKILSVGEAAYLAGLIDGEGSIALWRGRQKDGVVHTYRPVIEISNTHEGVLQWVADLIGAGWFSVTNHKNIVDKGHRPLHRFRFRTQDLRWLIPQIKPFLKIKSAQADLLLDYFSKVTSTRATMSKSDLDLCWQAMRELNRRYGK